MHWLRQNRGGHAESCGDGLRLNVRFVVRGLLLVLPVAAIGSVALTLVMIRVQIGGPPDPTPPPPAIFAPRGELPAGLVGLQEWARYWGEAYSLVGSGFLIPLSDGTIVGVTTAHSVSLGNPDRPLEQIALGVSDRHVRRAGSEHHARPRSTGRI